VLVRADSGGGTKAFLGHVTGLELQYSVGFYASTFVVDALASVPRQAWRAAVEPDGAQRRDQSDHTDRKERPRSRKIEVRWATRGVAGQEGGVGFFGMGCFVAGCFVAGCFVFAGWAGTAVSSSRRCRLWRTRAPSVVNQKGGSDRRR